MITDGLLRLMLGLSLAASLVTGCGRAPTEPAPETASMSPTASHLSLAQAPTCQAGSLSMVSPLETTELYGGQPLRPAVHLADCDGRPVEGATVQAELWSPSGDLFAAPPCADKGRGSYLADYVTLPMRGAGGTWRLVASATWGEDSRAQAERTFTGIASPSEMYQSQYGFWVDPPCYFNYNLAMYNLHGTGGFHYEDHAYEDGGGYVILDNYRYNVAGVTFAGLDVHWRHADFPADEIAAIAHVQELAGLNHQEPDTPITGLTAEPTVFQDRPAWHVIAQWKKAYTTRSASSRPAEWLIFRCPDSDWLWTLAISADKTTYMDYLRGVRQTFECPVSE